MIRLLTWNVNSVRRRIDHCMNVIECFGPDILCFQETKCVDDQFPLHVFAERGYNHHFIWGQKSYNGVCILSRLPLEESCRIDLLECGEARHISARVVSENRSFQLHNLYIPAGGDVPDPFENPKFDHKLKFVKALTKLWAGKQDELMICLGDFNIAPLPKDVWSHKQMLKVVSHTPIETSHLEDMQQSAGWIDLVRAFTSPEISLYTWWSYRLREWQGMDSRGLRLDHIWATPAIAKYAEDCRVLFEPRSWSGPSDHAPVLLDLNF